MIVVAWWKLYLAFEKFVIVALALSLGACGSKPEEPSFGLRKFHLTVKPEVLSGLAHTVDVKRPYPAKAHWGGKDYKVSINYAGRSTRDAIKKSYDVTLVDHKVEGQGSLRLSSQFVDPTLLRSLIGFPAFGDYLVPTVEPVVLYLNNKYQGLYQLIEVVNEDFFHNRGIEITHLYKAKLANAGFSLDFYNNVKGAFSSRIEPKTFGPLQYLYQLVLSADTDSYQKIVEIVDVDQVMAYAATATYLKHWDGFNNNYFLARFKSDGKFRIIPWDLDRIYESTNQNKDSFPQRNALFAKLLSNEHNQTIYANHLAALKAGSSTSKTALLAQLDQLKNRIQEAHLRDPYLQVSYSFEEDYSEIRQNISSWLDDL